MLEVCYNTDIDNRDPEQITALLLYSIATAEKDGAGAAMQRTLQRTSQRTMTLAMSLRKSQ